MSVQGPSVERDSGPPRVGAAGTYEPPNMGAGTGTGSPAGAANALLTAGSLLQFP